MPQLCTHKDFQAVGKLPFCYLCGKTFTGKFGKNRDHVPPRSIFASQDYRPPLILPTHASCNGAQSAYDEIVGQLIAVIHGKYPDPARMRLDVQVNEDPITGAHSAWLSDTNLHRTICRWLRAFHAALYQEYLPDNDATNDGTKFSFDPPFPVGHLEEGNEIRVDPIRPHHCYFVERIKQNRAAGRLDRIVCFNGKCIYECVWDSADRGESICIFALNVYDWGALGNTDDYPKRGCVGVYVPARGRPAGGTLATVLAIPVSNAEKLDPFGK